MMTAPLYRLLLCAPLWALLGGCEGQSGEPLPAGMPDAPCRCDPAKPETCKITYKNPQICPDLSPVQFCSRFIGGVVTTDVLLANRGLQGLRISSVKLLGDDNCSFEPPKLSFSAGSSIIDFMRQESVRLTYRPKSQAADHLVLLVSSNAENFPELRIAVCGQGIPQGMPMGGDGGACLQCMKPKTETMAACASPPDGGT